MSAVELRKPRVHRYFFFHFYGWKFLIYSHRSFAVIRPFFQRPQFNKPNGCDCMRIKQQQTHAVAWPDWNQWIYSVSPGAAIHEIRDWKFIGVWNRDEKKNTYRRTAACCSVENNVARNVMVSGVKVTDCNCSVNTKRINRHWTQQNCCAAHCMQILEMNSNAVESIRYFSSHSSLVCFFSIYFVFFHSRFYFLLLFFGFHNLYWALNKQTKHSQDQSERNERRNRRRKKTKTKWKIVFKWWTEKRMKANRQKSAQWREKEPNVNTTKLQILLCVL